MCRVHCNTLLTNVIIDCRKTGSSVISDAASVISQQRSTQHYSFDDLVAAEQTGVRTFELVIAIHNDSCCDW